MGRDKKYVYKRSDERRVTRESEILRFLRRSKKIPMRKAGEMCGLSDSSIAHYETGRMDISHTRIQQLVSAYGYTMKDFQEYLDGKPIPVLNLKDECISILNHIDDSKLRAVHAVLTSFTA